MENLRVSRKKISFFFQTAERMSAPGEAAKVRLPQRFYGAAPPVRGGLAYVMTSRGGVGPLCSLLYGYILNLFGKSEGLEKKISFFFQTAERMSAPPEEAAKVRLPQRRRRRRGGLCPGRPLTGVRTLGDAIGAYRWLKANELVRGRLVCMEGA